MEVKYKQNEIKFAKDKSNYTNKIMGELTDEIQKVHDLEHLLRKKEQTIEILRGDLQEIKEICFQKDDYIQAVESKNIELLESND